MANDATMVRVLLQRGGYAPIPVRGKVPSLQRWQEHTQTNGDEIALWEKLYRDAVNTGILTARNPTIDIDLLDEAAAEAVEALVREMFEARGFVLVRIGKAPKRAIILRTDRPFPKMTRTVVAANGNSEKIEVLCDGQQVVVYGVHPETRHPYLWHGGEPGKIACADLPYASGDELAEFLDRAVALLVREHGYRDAVERPTRMNGPTNGRGGDWGFLTGNIIAGHELHDSSRDLAAKYAKAGMAGGTIVNVLRGLFEACTAQLDTARKKDFDTRYADIPRTVDSALRKYGRQPAEQPTAAGEEPRVFHLDRPPEDGTMQTDWLIENVLPRRGVGILSGWPGVGKTHVLNDMMCSVATGIPFAGHEVARVCGAVLFAAEGANTAHPRWEVLRHAKTGPYFESIGEPTDRAFPVSFTDQVPYLNEDDAFEQYDRLLTEIAAAQAEHMAAAGITYDGLGLVNIDTYNAALSFADEQHNKVGPNQAVFNMARRLAMKHDCFMLFTDHLGKDQSKGPLGTIAKSAACDVDLRITGVVGEDGSVSHCSMSVHKLRAGAQGGKLPFELKVLSAVGGPQGIMVRWDVSGTGMHVPRQNKRHPLLMKAMDEAINEHWQWVRVGQDMNFKATDSRLVRRHFELSHPATAEQGGKRDQTIKRAFNRAMRDSSKVGLIGSKTLEDKTVMVWRTDYKFGDSYELSRE
jgi:AAA domain/Bifunctional DNA primase/polymerase, N-terminal